MDDIKLLDTVERYIRGEMKPDERLQFEQLRKSNSEVDQLVVEHTLFLQQINHFGERKTFRSSLNDIHTDLTEQGKIDSMKLKGKAKIVYLWKRYKRVTAIAASIAGITALAISALVVAVAPKNDGSNVKDLVHKVQDEVRGIKNDQEALKKDQKQIIDKINNDSKSVINTPIRYNGTGFLIDGKGYLITNAHVVKNSKNIYIQNNKGDQYKVKVVQLDISRDIAILKITDKNYKPTNGLPYGIKKSGIGLAEPIYTLGFPRNDEIVYGEGYLSAKTGYNGDTLSCQIAVAANPGNSGGPVLDQNGEIIGILSNKEINQEGAVFAIQSKYIYNAIEELKKDTSYRSVKVISNSSLKGMNKQQQVKKIQDYIFMVKGD
ncbi:MAG: trypsin-like peptidase domain-containing protein [Bacteroidetes bacterium]|nr:trypsin-like peptidase domain-containing protein [Bacteroidota bacterium]